MKNDREIIPGDQYRVIKISKDAIFELLYESIIDRQDAFFGVRKFKNGKPYIVTCFDINWETGEFIAIARNEQEENEHLQFDGIDTQLLLKNMEDTTASLFHENRFVDLTADELEELQKQ